MPLGLIKAPIAFMNLMNIVLKPFLDQFVMAFIDGILVYSMSQEKHEGHLMIVLQTLSENKIM